ncbi:S66 family peptidase [Alkalicoccobacillus plakortidis]|uniref:LD-carboxypeptidase n=1 Tax=Alkalicoccobacillus plakortidis TaxID=444060 RepID=A0ABT0XN43_9BACI|nr:S66 peptidase family protein [Alkalicoccobacillus plakortidis]MCM2677326.1 LD-carboxypeptidase [Alkalicoccobacillus plakortidis]
MITYPHMKKGATIGVTATSSGVPLELHHIVKEASARLKERGYHLQCGETVWTQVKARSASAEVRAEEFNRMMTDDQVDLIIPPWGGELLIEVLEHLDFESIQSKWILGYSDVSMLLLAVTLQTGMATAHGTNLVDLRGEEYDATTAMWEQVLSTEAGGEVIQYSSEKYQKEWDFENPSPHVFHLNETTEWKSSTGQKVEVEGRLLGGCVDVIHHLVGTPYGDVSTFRRQFVEEEPVLWFFENCEMTTTDLKRALIQMKLAGWFEHCSGILFGRSAANTPVEGYTTEDVYQDLTEELGVPVIYEIDCGHVPPQLTLINGAYAKVETEDGKGKVTQWFK